MRRILNFVASLLLSGLMLPGLQGQSSSVPASPVLVSVGAPSGTCTPFTLDVDSTTGNLYACKVAGGIGAWQLSTGSLTSIPLMPATTVAYSATPAFVCSASPGGT